MTPKNKISPAVEFLFTIAKFQAEITRRIDSRLGPCGLGFNELIILYHLNMAEGQKMRRIDLADKVGLTASGITRLLLPMEKIGLVSKEVNEYDARVSYVVLAPGGRVKLGDGLERIEYIGKELVPENKIKKMEELSALLAETGKNI
jgi:DNA-binding MarR family transcriptional regulator